MALLMGSPLLVEAAIRQRIATTNELAALRRVWPMVQGLLGVEPFVTCAHSNRERLLEAVPEIGLAQPRQRQLSIVYGTTATVRKFGEVLSEELGARVLPGDLKSLS